MPEFIVQTTGPAEECELQFQVVHAVELEAELVENLPGIQLAETRMCGLKSYLGRVIPIQAPIQHHVVSVQAPQGRWAVVGRAEVREP